MSHNTNNKVALGLQKIAVVFISRYSNTAEPLAIHYMHLTGKTTALHPVSIAAHSFHSCFLQKLLLQTPINFLKIITQVA